jgi:hypothetical protein
MAVGYVTPGMVDVAYHLDALQRGDDDAVQRQVELFKKIRDREREKRYEDWDKWKIQKHQENLDRYQKIAEPYLRWKMAEYERTGERAPGFQPTGRWWMDRLDAATGAVSIVELFGGGDVASLKRYQSGTANIHDLKWLASMGAEIQLADKQGFWADTRDMTTMIPAYMASFLGTGKLARGILGISKVGGKSLTARFGDAVKQGILQGPMQVGIVAPSTARRHNPKLTFNADGRVEVKDGEDLPQAIREGILDGYVQTYSEMTGGVIMALGPSQAAKLAKTAIMTAAYKAAKIRFPTGAKAVVDRVFREGGYHGIFAEFGEEFVAAGAGKGLGLERDWGEFQSLMDGDFPQAMRDLGPMVVSFAAIPVAKTGIAVAPLATEKGREAEAARIRSQMRQEARQERGIQRLDKITADRIDQPMADDFSRLKRSKRQRAAYDVLRKKATDNEPISRRDLQRAGMRGEIISAFPRGESRQRLAELLPPLPGAEDAVLEEFQLGPHLPPTYPEPPTTEQPPVEPPTTEVPPADQEIPPTTEQPPVEPPQQEVDWPAVKAQAITNIKEQNGFDVKEVPIPKGSVGKDVDALMNKAGHQVMWVDDVSDKPGFNGSFDPVNGLVVLQTPRKGDINRFWHTVGHELAHATEVDQLRNLVPESQIAQLMGERLKNASPQYRAAMQDNPDLMYREGVAEYVGKFFSQAPFRNEILKKDFDLWRRIVHEVNRVLSGVQLSGGQQRVLAALNKKLATEEQKRDIPPSEPPTVEQVWFQGRKVNVQDRKHDIIEHLDTEWRRAEALAADLRRSRKRGDDPAEWYRKRVGGDFQPPMSWAKAAKFVDFKRNDLKTSDLAKAVGWKQPLSYRAEGLPSQQIEAAIIDPQGRDREIGRRAAPPQKPLEERVDWDVVQKRFSKRAHDNLRKWVSQGFDVSQAVEQAVAESKGGTINLPAMQKLMRPIFEEHKKLVQGLKPGRREASPAFGAEAARGAPEGVHSRTPSVEDSAMVRDYQGQRMVPNTDFTWSDRIDALLDAMGVPHSERYMPFKLLGYYAHRSKKIAVQSMADVFTVAHEVAHWIDFSLDLNLNRRVRSEAPAIADQLGDAFRRYYPGDPAKKAEASKRTQAVEGIAVLIERYAHDPAEIDRLYPGLVNAFLKPDGQFYHPQFTELLDGITEIVSDYARLPDEYKTGARIKRKFPKRDKGFNVAEQTVFNMFSAAEPLMRLARIAKVSETNDDATVWYYHWLDRASVVANWIQGKSLGWLDRNGNMRSQPFSQATLMKMIEGNENEFGDFAIARRVVEDHNELTEMKELLEDLNTALENLNTQLEDPALTEDEIAQTEQLIQLAQAEIAALTEDIESKEAQINRDDFSLAHATHAVSTWEDKFREPIKIFDAIHQEILDMLHNHGILTDTEYADYKSRKGYASFQRYLHDSIGPESDNAVGVDSSHRVSSLRNRRGSPLDIVDPLWSQQRAIFEAVSKAMQNAVRSKLVEMGNANPEVARRYEFINVKPTWNQEKKRREWPQPKNDEQIVWLNGTRTYMRLAPELRELMKFMTPGDFGVFHKFMIAPSQLFTRLTTSANPIWSLSNFTVDQISAWMQTKTGLKPGIDPVKSIIQMIQEVEDTDAGTFLTAMRKVIPGLSHSRATKMWQEFKLAGGERHTMAGFLRGEDPSEWIKSLHKPDTKYEAGLRKAGELFSLVEIPGNFAEMLTRFSEYRRSIELGEPASVAMFRASEVTVPFKVRGNMWGKGGQVWQRSVPYFGAQLAVLYKYGRTVKDNPKRLAAISAGMATATVLHTIAIMRFGSDEQKEQLLNREAAELARYIFVPIPGGRGPLNRLVRIRIPEFIGSIAAPISMATIAAYKKSPVQMDEVFDSMTAWMPDQIDAFSGSRWLASMVPQAIKPSLEVAMNVRTYPRVGPLVPEYLENRFGEDQYTSYTSELAKFMGRLTAGIRGEGAGISPVKIEHWTRNQFGAIGGMVHGKFQSLPFTRISTEIGLAGRVYNNFYNQMQMLDKQKRKMTEDPNRYSEQESAEILQDHRTYHDVADILADLRKQTPLPESTYRMTMDLLLSLERGDVIDPQQLGRIAGMTRASLIEGDDPAAVRRRMQSLRRSANRNLKRSPNETREEFNQRREREVFLQSRALSELQQLRQ